MLTREPIPNVSMFGLDHCPVVAALNRRLDALRARRDQVAGEIATAPAGALSSLRRELRLLEEAIEFGSREGLRIWVAGFSRGAEAGRAVAPGRGPRHPANHRPDAGAS